MTNEAIRAQQLVQYQIIFKAIIVQFLADVPIIMKVGISDSDQ